MKNINVSLASVAWSMRYVHQLRVNINRVFTLPIMALVGLVAAVPAQAAPPGTWPANECVTVGQPCSPTAKKFHPGFYGSFGGGKGVGNGYETTGTFDLIKGNPDFIGAARYWFWNDLELSFGNYDFSGIDKDLENAKKLGKAYGVILIATNYHAATPRTPSYMWNDPKYGGEPGKYSTIPNASDANIQEPVLWNQFVLDRFFALLSALAAKYDNDPSFAFVMLDETDLAGAVNGYDWSVQKEESAFRARLLSALQSFRRTQVFQEINFTSGWDLAAFSAWAVQQGTGLAGPDVQPYDAWLKGPYPIQRTYHNQVPIEISVEWTNFDSQNPSQLLATAIQEVNPHYMVWDLTRSPFQSEVFSAVRNFINTQGSAWPRPPPASVN